MITTGPFETINESSMALHFRRLVSGALLTFVLAVVFTLVIARFFFSSFVAAAAWASGPVILIEPAILDLGEVTAGEEYTVRFGVRNLDSSPVTIVGASPGCSCEVVKGLPITIDRGVDFVEVRFTPGSYDAGKTVEREIPLHLNVNAARTTLKFRASVRPVILLSRQ